MLEILKSVYCQVCFGQRTNLTLLACLYLLAVARFRRLLAASLNKELKLFNTSSYFKILIK